MAKFSMWASGLCTGATIISFINNNVFSGICLMGAAIFLLFDGISN